MKEDLVISVDAMGGDMGPEMVIPGVDISLERHPKLRLILYGDKTQIEPLLEQYPRVKERSEFVHTDVWISMNDKPSQALRRGRRVSSMWMAIEAVKEQRADVAISAGNTGAWMVMAKMRPAPSEGSSTSFWRGVITQ